MSKLEWGTKRLCQSCGTKFYDLQRAPVTCPSCGAEADRETPLKRTPLKSRRARSPAAAPKPMPVEKVKTPKVVAAEADGEEGELSCSAGATTPDTDRRDETG